MKWFGYMCVSIKSNLDTAISDNIVEYTNGRYSLMEEKEILAEAIRQWLILNQS